MRRTTSACFSVLLLLLAARPGAAASGAETWYAQRVTAGDAPVRVDHLWSKGQRLRSETVIAGHPILTLVNGERYFVIDVINRRGVSIRRNPAAVAADPARGRPFGREVDELVSAGAEKVGTEKIGPRACELYRITDGQGRREVCVTSDAARLPLQMSVWSRASNQAVTIRYVDWTRDMTMPDAFFEPDPGIQIESIEYQEYLERSRKEPVGPAPPFFSNLLHGTR